MFESISDFNYAFYNCGLTQITLPEGTNYESAVDFRCTFQGCTALGSIDNLDKFTNIKSLLYTFDGCTSLTNIELCANPTGSIESTGFGETFRNCTNLTSIVNFEKLAGTNSFTSTFSGCANLVSITLPLPTSGANYPSFSNTFSGCAKLTTINNLELYANTTNLVGTFKGCTALREIHLGTVTTSGMANTTGTFDDMTAGCVVYLLKGSVVPTKWATNYEDTKLVAFVIDAPMVTTDTGQVINFATAGATPDWLAKCNLCTTAETLTLTGTWTPKQLNGLRASMKGNITYKAGENNKLRIVDMSKVELSGSFSDFNQGMSYLFFGCQELEQVTLPEAQGDITGSAILFMYTFQGCIKLSTITNLGVFTKAGNFSYAFRYCKSLKEITLPSKQEYTGSGISFCSAFDGCNSLSVINNLELFTKASDFTGTFYSCKSLKKITLPTAQEYTDGGISFYRTFSGCDSLLAVNNLELFTNAKDFGYAFHGCKSLKEITLPTAQEYTDGGGIPFNYAFYGCDSLLAVNNLELFTKANNFIGAFRNCYQLASVRLGIDPSGLAYNPQNTFEGTNPNCLKYLPAGSTIPTNWSSYSNFIIGGTAQGNIELTDGKPFHCPAAFSMGANTISYTRNWTLARRISGKGYGWNALTLPFTGNVYVGEETDARPHFTSDTDPNGAYWLKRFAGTEDDSESGTTIVKFEHEGNAESGVPAGIQANIPYIIALPGETFGEDASMEGKTITIKATDITVPATPVAIVDTQTDATYQYIGNYTPVDETGIYRLARGTTGVNTPVEAFLQVEDGDNAPALNPFRAYFKATTGSGNNARRLVIGDGNGSTGITLPTISNDDDSNNANKPRKVMTKEGIRIIVGDRVYTVDGRMVELTN